MRFKVFLMTSILSFVFCSPSHGLINGGFENGRDGSWIESSSNDFSLILNTADLRGIIPQNGDWAVWLGGADNEISILSQSINIPSTATFLNFYYWSESYDSECGYDYAQLFLGTNLLLTLDLCEQTNTNSWVQRNIDISPYREQTLQLTFRITTDNLEESWSNFFLDSVSISQTTNLYTVIANGQGNGSGIISGNLSGDGITATWDGSLLSGDNSATVPVGSGPYTISAVANLGSKVSWSGCDNATGNDTSSANCIINLVDADRTVTSNFSLSDNNKYFLFLPLILTSKTSWVMFRPANGSVDLWASDAQITSDGGLVMAGSSSDGYIWIMKLDSNYYPRWTKKINSSNTGIGSIRQTNDGGYILSLSFFGEQYNYNSEGALIMKLDFNGNIVWQKIFNSSRGSDKIYYITQTADNGFLGVGHFSDYSVPLSLIPGDAWILKLDPNGNIQWQKKLGGIWQDEVYSFQEFNDSFIIVGSYRQDNSNTYDIWILKIDKSGNIIWQKSIYNWNYSNTLIEKSNDNGVVISTGECYSQFQCSLKLFKLNSTGNLDWIRKYGVTGEMNISSLRQTHDGGYIIGFEYQPSSSQNGVMVVLKVDSAGNIQWQRQITNGIDNQTWEAIVNQNSKNEYIVVGNLKNVNNKYESVILNLDVNGNLSGPCSNLVSPSFLSQQNLSGTLYNTLFNPVNADATSYNSFLVPENMAVIENRCFQQ